eukprot:c7378_g1_i1.p1 GENE.c7378_g1_i1~~c7378_g1_i1.p1  ORF type:complete len:2037 (-),score=525.73 c7378_g1_i1:323-5599(-)
MSGWVRTGMDRDNVTAEFVRMMGLKRGTTYGYSIYNLHVYGTTLDVGVSGVVVTSSNISIGSRVVRGLHWSATSPAFDGVANTPGTIVAFCRADGSLDGNFIGPRGCCTVLWDLTQEKSPHRIGFEKKFELCFATGKAPEGSEPGLSEADIALAAEAFSDATTSLESSLANAIPEAKTASSIIWSAARWDREPWKSLLQTRATQQVVPQPLDPSRVKRVLNGEIESDDVQVQHKTVSIFVSSTFTDTAEERNLLIADVYPYLRRYGMYVGLDFSASEMRWGIRDESGNTHQTSTICMAELARCQRESQGINYVLMLADKYGYRPFPSSIPVPEFEALTQKLKDTPGAEDDAALVLDWFVLNTNVVPPAFELLPSTRAAPGTWWSIFERMQRAFRTARDVVEDPIRRELYLVSVTEHEVINGLLTREDRDETTFYYRRRIRDMENFISEAKAGLFLDKDPVTKGVDREAQTLLADLRDNKVMAKISRDRVKDFEIDWGHDNAVSTETHADYLREFCDHFCDTLRQSIDKAAQKVTVEPDETFQEALAHLMFCEKRGRNAVARQEVTDIVMSYLQALEDSDEIDATKPLVLFGPGGSGKSVAMARCVVWVVREAISNCVLICRFIGTTPHSTTGQALLRSICLQISRCFDLPTDAVPTNYKDLVIFFAELLSQATEEKPLVIFLDSLDQLSQQDNAHNLGWLPLTLPTHCHIVTSTLKSDGEGGNALLKLKALLPEHNFVELVSLDHSNAQSMLESWLGTAKRTLTDEQCALVMQAYSSCPLPLYLRIVFQMTLGWASSTVPAPHEPNTALFAPSIPLLLRDLFDGLCRIHGKILVHHALGYLTLARHGLSRAELEDILSLDDEVLNDVFEWWTPPIRRIPGLLVTRLLSEVESFLVTQGADGGVPVLSWYHREFKVASKQAFLSDPAQAQKLSNNLAEYFGNTWGMRAKPYVGRKGDQGCADRKITPQELVISDSTTSLNKKFNQRRVSELPSALIGAKNWTQVEKTLTDIQFLEASALLEVPHETLADVRRALEGMRANDTPISEPLSEAEWFLTQNMYTLQQKPASFFQVTMNHPIFKVSAKTHLTAPASGWLRQVNATTSGSAVLTTFLAGPLGGYQSCKAIAFSPNNQLIAALTNGDTGSVYHLTVFDVTTNTEVFDYCIESVSTEAVTWSVDSKYVVLPVSSDEPNSGVDVPSLRLISAKIGVVERIIQGKQNAHISSSIVSAVTLSDDLVVTGHNVEEDSKSHPVEVWSLSKGHRKSLKMKGADGETHLAVTTDRQFFVSLSENGHCRVWKTSNLELIRTLECGSGMKRVAISPDASIVATNRSDDGTHGYDGDGFVAYSDQFDEPKFVGIPHLDATGSAINTVGIAFHPNSSDILYLLDSSSNIRTFNTKTQRALSTITASGFCFNGNLSISPNSRLIATIGQEYNVRVWNPSPVSKVDGKDEAFLGDVDAVTLSNDGSVYALVHHHQDRIFVHDSVTSKLKRAIAHSATGASRVVFSRDGSKIACTLNSPGVFVAFLSEASGFDDEPENTMTILEDSAQQDLIFHPSGESLIVLGEGDSRLIHVRLEDQEVLWEITTATTDSLGRAGGVMLQISESGDLVACYTSDGLLGLFDTQTGSLVDSFAVTEYSSCYRLSPDFQTLITCRQTDDNDVYRVEKHSRGSETAQLSIAAHTTNITGLFVVPEKQLIVSCSEDGSLRVWNSETGELQGVYFNPGRQFINAFHAVVLPGENVLRLAFGDATGRTVVLDWIV